MLPREVFPTGPSVANLTFDTRLLLYSQSNIEIKSYTSTIYFPVLLLRPMLAVERAAAGSKCRARNASDCVLRNC
jgi:hypothetical protein